MKEDRNQPGRLLALTFPLRYTRSLQECDRLTALIYFQFRSTTRHLAQSEPVEECSSGPQKSPSMNSG